MTTFFLPLSSTSELLVQVIRRDYNGIDSDPQIHTSVPCAEELIAALQGVPVKIRRESTLPDGKEPPAFWQKYQTQFFDSSGLEKNTPRPGLAGGSEASRGGSAVSAGSVRISHDERPFSQWPEFSIESTPREPGDSLLDYAQATAENLYQANRKGAEVAEGAPPTSSHFPTDTAVS